MTTKKDNDADLTIEPSGHIRTSFAGLWALIVAVGIGSAAIVGNQLRTEYKIEKLYTQNELSHTMILTKLGEMDNRINLAALRSSVENAIVYVAKLRDTKAGTTNVVVMDEIKFREDLRNFLR